MSDTRLDSLWNLRTLAECLLETPLDAPVNAGLARDLARAALAADVSLRRYEERQAMQYPILTTLSIYLPRVWRRIRGASS